MRLLLLVGLVLGGSWLTSAQVADAQEFRGPYAVHHPDYHNHHGGRPAPHNAGRRALANSLDRRAYLRDLARYEAMNDWQRRSYDCR